MRTKLILSLVSAVTAVLFLTPAGATAQRPAPINVDSTPPGAMVYVDSDTTPAIGKTPVKRVKVDRGAHTLILKLEGYDDLKLPVEVRVAGQRFKGTLTALATVAISAGGASAEGADVRIDGQPVGTVPYRGTAKPGRHLIQVGKAGYQTYSQWTDLTGGQLLTLPVMLEKAAPDTGSILVAGDVPGAPIYLDGEAKGVTPAVLDSVSVGEHLVEIRAPGMEAHRQTVRVLAGERLNVNPTFRAAATGGSLRVIANVPKVMVSIDGEPVGEAPVTKEKLAAGEHIVEGSSAGFASAQQTVQVSEGQQRVVSLQLVPQAQAAGRIVVNSSIGTAKVTIDGQDRGTPPVIIEKPTDGAHAIIVQAAGYQDLRTTCETGPGRSCDITADLEAVGVPIRVLCNVREAELFIDGKSIGGMPYEGSAPVGAHRLEVKAKGFETYLEQVQLVPSTASREFIVELAEDNGEGTPLERKRKAQEAIEAATGATTHSAAPLHPDVAALDLSLGWPYLAEVRLQIGILEFLEGGFAFRTFGRLNEFELRGKMGFRPTRQVSVGVQARVGGGIGPGRDALASEGPDAESHPVNAWFLSVEALGTLHFSDHGAFTLWLATDFHTDRYDWSGTDSDLLSTRAINGDRQDTARFRMGGALEIVFDRHWNGFGSFEGVMAGPDRAILGDLYGFGNEDTNLYFRLGTTYKF